MTLPLTDALALLAHWPEVRFGTVYPLVAPADREALKRAFVHRERASLALPVEQSSSSAQLRAVHPVPSRNGTTGEICPMCQGVNFLQTGTCRTCLDCGHNSGCG